MMKSLFFVSRSFFLSLSLSFVGVFVSACVCVCVCLARVLFGSLRVFLGTVCFLGFVIHDRLEMVKFIFVSLELLQQ